MERLDEIRENFRKLIESKCGMVITDIHVKRMEEYIAETAERKNLNCSQLYDLINGNPSELSNLINAVVINETYFFREEKQFEFLRDYLIKNFQNSDVVIWSAACSTGEEPYSLASLAVSCNTNPIVYATDIDTIALGSAKKGVYNKSSFRPDGKNLKIYLEPFLTELNEKDFVVYSINPELKQKVKFGYANLIDINSSCDVPPNESVDIIFIRNVFIYFNRETRAAIIKQLASKLRDGGIMIFSISEIAGIDSKTSDVPLVKTNQGSVFYFIKQTGKNEIKIKDAVVSAENAVEKKTAEILISSLQNKKSFESGKTVDNKKSEPTNAICGSAKDVWKGIQRCIEKKDYSLAMSIVEEYSPAVNDLYFKYYFQGIVFAEKKMEVKAVESFEKAGIANPHFWPAFYQLACVQQFSKDSSSRKSRFNALKKVTSIFEKEKCGQYSWVLGDFSAEYFYKLCVDILKKECQ